MQTVASIGQSPAIHGSTTFSNLVPSFVLVSQAKNRQQSLYSPPSKKKKKKKKKRERPIPSSIIGQTLLIKLFCPQIPQLALKFFWTTTKGVIIRVSQSCP